MAADGGRPAELRALAAAPPRRTRELHPFNAFYGHDRIIKRYAGLPLDRPLKATIEHGLALAPTVADVDRRLGLPVQLCLSPLRAAVVAQQLPGVEAVPIGPMSHYAAALHRVAGRAPRRRLVLFPAHSTDTVTAEYDADLLVRATAAYAARFDETVVCLYWRDVLLGRDAVYRDHGLACTTAGSMHDDAFLFRLLDLLGSAAALATNEIGTHVVYAVLLGLPVWHVAQDVSYAAEGAPPDQLRALAELAREPLRDRLRSAFAAPRDAPTEEQSRLIADVAGAASVRTPDELRAILEEAEARYRCLPLRRRLANSARAQVRRWR